MTWEEYLALPERPRAEWVDGVAVRVELAGVTVPLDLRQLLRN
jgi:hypothetical protein